MSAADELVHMVRQAAQQQAEDGLGPFAYGHIASYDPARHRVRVIFPGRRDENGLLVMSGWMPMSTAAVGAGWGLQYVPVGGATQQNPTAGEQVLVGILDRKRGTAAVLAVYYGADAAPSPGTSPAPLADAGAPAAAAAFAFPTPAANLPRSPWEALAVPLADRTAPSAAPSFSPATAEAVTLIASPASTDAATDSNLAVAASDTLLLSSSELSASAPEARRSPRAREENFAARAEKIGCEKISARSALPKTFLNPPEKRVTSGDPDLGIGVAKPATDMPAATFANRSAPAAVLVHTAAASVAVAAPDLLARSAPLLASDAPSTAQRAVDAVLTATDRFAAGDRHAVNLQFFVGGADLAVRVELRANEVRATFRTDSAELRTALAHEWQAVSGDATDRPVRLAPPVFTSSSGDVSGFAAFTGDNASRQRDSAPRRASEEIFATIASRSRAVSSATGEPDEVALPISRFASLPTSLHLHTLA